MGANNIKDLPIENIENNETIKMNDHNDNDDYSTNVKNIEGRKLKNRS